MSEKMKQQSIEQKEQKSVNEKEKRVLIDSDFLSNLIYNLEKTSRTAKGISDISSSAEKPKLAEEGELLKEKTRENFEKAVQFVWQEKYHYFDNPKELRSFIEQIAGIINEGLLKKGQGLFRTWRTKLEHQTPPENIEKDFDNFVVELYNKIHMPHADGHSIAAFIEQQIDSRIHPFSDGCGRIAKVLSAWILARYHLPLPKWTTRDEYYENIEKDFSTWEKYFKDHVEGINDPIVINTHKNVDLDAVCSVWAYKYYAIPKDKEVKINFVPASTKKNLKITDIYLDIDGGIKGLKEGKDGKIHSCLKQLLKIYAPKEDEQSLEYLVDYIDRVDTYGLWDLVKDLKAYDTRIISENTLHGILENLRYSNLPHKDEDICSIFEEICNGALKKGHLRIAAEEEVKRTEFPFGNDIAIIREKKSPFTMGLLFKKGAKVVIYTDGMNIGVVRKDGETFSLKDLLEEELTKIEEGWFFHEHGFLAARGTFKNPAESKSSIDPVKIAEILSKKISGK